MMRSKLLFVLLVLATVGAAAQSSDQSYQHQIDQMRLQQMQNDLALSRMQADTERMRQATERMRAEDAQARQAEQLNDLMSQRAAEESESVKKAQEAADDLREEMELASVRTADLVYLLLSLSLPVLLGIFVAKRKAKEGIMKSEQKFGVVLIVCALLMALLAITISANWSPRLDALQNILLTLRIKLFPEFESEYAPTMIDIPTKYVLGVLAVVVAYGFTTYLGITPAWKRTPKAPSTQETSSD